MGSFREEMAKRRAGVKADVPAHTAGGAITEADFLSDLEALENGEEKPAPRIQGIPDDFEVNARLTVYRMIATVPELEKPYTFKTTRFGGKAHVQAMRVALSRARADMRAAGKAPKVDFKFFMVSIEHLPTHDLVTVMRSAHASLRQRHASDEIIALLADGKEKK